MEVKCAVKKFVNPSSKILGTATVDLTTDAGILKLAGYKIIQGKKGPWVAPPTEFWKNGKNEPVNRVLVTAPQTLAADIAKKIMDEFILPGAA